MHILRSVLLVLLLSVVTLVAGPPYTARAQEAAAVPYGVDVQTALLFTDADHGNLRLDVYRPAGAPRPLPVVLAVHGGSWLVGSRAEMAPFAEYLTEQGYAVVACDYHYAPAYHYPTQVDDVRAALRWINDHATEQGFDVKRVAVAGASAGVQMVALAALTPGPGEPAIRGVVDLYGPTDFTAPDADEKNILTVQLYLGATREEQPDLYASASPISHVTAAAPPFLVMHGTADKVVPYNQSERMVAALQAAGVPVTFLAFPGGGHNLVRMEAGEHSAVFTSVFNFLQTVCPPG
jgi:acetyl esterase/lipase